MKINIKTILLLISLITLINSINAVVTIGNFALLTAVSSTGPIGWVFLTGTVITLGLYVSLGGFNSGKEIKTNIYNVNYGELKIGDIIIKQGETKEVKINENIIINSSKMECPLIKLTFEHINIKYPYSNEPIKIGHSDYGYICDSHGTMFCNDNGSNGNRYVYLKYKDKCIGEKMYGYKNGKEFEMKNVKSLNMSIICEENCDIINSEISFRPQGRIGLTNSSSSTIDNIKAIVHIDTFGSKNYVYSGYTQTPYTIGLSPDPSFIDAGISLLKEKENKIIRNNDNINIKLLF